MTVAQICQRQVDLVDLDESTWAAAERMRQRGVGSLIVLSRERKPLGIVTDRDLVEKVIAAERSPRTTRVREVMTTPVKTALESASLQWALGIMRDTGIRQLPVVDGAGRLVGILTLDGILAHLAQEQRDLGQLLNQPAPPAASTPPESES